MGQRISMPILKTLINAQDDLNNAINDETKVSSPLSEDASKPKETETQSLCGICSDGGAGCGKY